MTLYCSEAFIQFVTIDHLIWLRIRLMIAVVCMHSPLYLFTAQIHIDILHNMLTTWNEWTSPCKSTKSQQNRKTMYKLGVQIFMFTWFACVHTISLGVNINNEFTVHCWHEAPKLNAINLYWLYQPHYSTIKLIQ